MNLKLKAKLTGFALVVFITLGTAGMAVLAIDHVSLSLNQRLLGKELHEYTAQVTEALRILEDNGLARVESYVQRAQQDLLEHFASSSNDTFGELTIFDTAGRALLHPSATTRPRLPPETLRRIRQEGRVSCAIDDTERVGVSAPIPEWGWLLFVSVTEGKMVQTRNRYVRAVILLFLVMSTLGWWLLVHSARNIVDPVLDLAQAAADIQAGNWQAIPSPLRRNDEIGALSRNFGNMARELHSAQQDLLRQADSLRQTNARLEEEIAGHRRTESELRRATSTIAAIINAMPSVVIGVDEQSRVIHWNQAAENQTGIPSRSAITRRLEDVIPRLSYLREALRRAMENQKSVRLDSRAYVLHGEVRREDILIFPLTTEEEASAVIRLDDVTDRERMEEIMIQSEKMTSLGGLAAGMAHEINSPLAGITAQAYNIRNRIFGELEKNHAVAQDCGVSLEGVRRYVERRGLAAMLEDISEAGNRAAKIVANMLSFSRPSEKRLELQDLKEILEASLLLAASDYGLKKLGNFQKIQIVRHYQANMPALLCAEGELRQVFLNLLKNGAQAMAGQPEPTFVLRLMREGDNARIEIEDNGPGMTEAVRKRVFEPFFTTKPTGQGTGLGLWVSYFIVTEQHGGTMEVQSLPGQGCRFVIRLPLHGSPQTEASSRTAESREAPSA